MDLDTPTSAHLVEGGAQTTLTQGFAVVPKRRIVERTFGWLNRCRRLSKDFENRIRTHLALVMLAMIRAMVRRIARAY